MRNIGAFALGFLGVALMGFFALPRIVGPAPHGSGSSMFGGLDYQVSYLGFLLLGVVVVIALGCLIGFIFSYLSSVPKLRGWHVILLIPPLGMLVFTVFTMRGSNSDEYTKPPSPPKQTGSPRITPPPTDPGRVDPKVEIARILGPLYLTGSEVSRYSKSSAEGSPTSWPLIVLEAPKNMTLEQVQSSYAMLKFETPNDQGIRLARTVRADGVPVNLALAAIPAGDMKGQVLIRIEVTP